uniref:CREWS-C3 n=1 Tax=Colubraria reticulata TaxID=604273 RepID=A0AA96UTL3_9CAEN|nr:CREWS-C3 [Colubraria reticulata]
MLLFHLFLLFVILCSSAAKRDLSCTKPDIRVLVDADVGQLDNYAISLMSKFIETPEEKDVTKFTHCDAHTAIENASKSIPDGKEGVIVFVTTKNNTVTTKALKAAKEVHYRKNLLLFAVGVGSDVNNTILEKLRRLATSIDPRSKQFVYTYKDIADLYIDQSKLATRICEGGNVTKPDTTKPAKPKPGRGRRPKANLATATSAEEESAKGRPSKAKRAGKPAKVGAKKPKPGHKDNIKLVNTVKPAVKPAIRTTRPPGTRG